MEAGVQVLAWVGAVWSVDCDRKAGYIMGLCRAGLGVGQGLVREELSTGFFFCMMVADSKSLESN